MKKNYSLKYMINTYILTLILSLIPYAFSASRMYAQGTKYENSEFINLFRIPNDFISKLFSPGSTQYQIKLAFDDSFGNYWLSPAEGTKVKDPTTGATYNSLKVNITITFKKKVFIKNMIYQAYSASGNLGLGYPEELNVYYSLQTGTNAKFTLADNIKTTKTDKKVVFTFTKILECYQINLEWKKISSSTVSSFANKATAKDIIFLFPETQYLNSTFTNIYDKNDYRQLTLSQSFKNYQNQNLLTSDLNKYGYNDYMKEYIKRFIAILKGELKYDPKREFTTELNTKVNKIDQWGDITIYSKNVLKMYWGATNKQSTGIYGRANEKITIYVKSTKSTDPLPKIQFTQYIGTYRNWLGKVYYLKSGKQTITVDNFILEDNLKIPTFPGGPAYLINPYNSTEQGQIYIYIEGGTLFPIIKLGGDETEYKQKLIECINLNKKDNKTYFDITELSSNRAMITVRASDAYKVYSNSNNITPLKNLAEWDAFIKKLYIFDGIQFRTNQPYYDSKNNYLKIHYKYSQSDTLAYSYTEFVGIHRDDWIIPALNFNIKQIGWGFAHETGHIMDISERVLSETSNNMISKYYDAYLCGNNTWGVNDHQKNKIKYLAPDNINDRLRGCKDSNTTNCKGFTKNIGLNYLIWWDLESMHHGYWGKLDNMYRFNNTFPLGIKKEEKMVYFSSLIHRIDLGYYFTRWGLSLNSDNIFDEKNVTTVYQNLMDEAVSKGLISRNTKTKFWYVDNEQYNSDNMFPVGCQYSNSVFQIEKVVKQATNKYLITLPKTGCECHLGFEIYETNTLIAFTYEYTYTDETVYKTGYTPKYKIVAYDRLLRNSKESAYKSFTNSVALKILNLNHILD